MITLVVKKDNAHHYLAGYAERWTYKLYEDKLVVFSEDQKEEIGEIVDIYGITPEKFANILSTNKELVITNEDK